MDFEQGQGSCTGCSVEHRWMVGRAEGSEPSWGLSQEPGGRLLGGLGQRAGGKQ